MKDDHRSYRHNFSSYEKKACKKCTGFEPLTVMILVISVWVKPHAVMISMWIKAGNTLRAWGGGTAIYGPYRYLLL